MFFFVGFFFYGMSFDHDPGFGITGVFGSGHMTMLVYLALLLTLGVFFSFILITKMFSDPLVPVLTFVFDSPATCFFLFVFGVQDMPGALGQMGFILIIPGSFLVLIGQHLFQQSQAK